jgi:hypothetical protein
MQRHVACAEGSQYAGACSPALGQRRRVPGDVLSELPTPDWFPRKEEPWEIEGNDSQCLAMISACGKKQKMW